MLEYPWTRSENGEQFEGLISSFEFKGQLLVEIFVVRITKINNLYAVTLKKPFPSCKSLIATTMQAKETMAY